MVGSGFASARDEADRLFVDTLLRWSESTQVTVRRMVRGGLDVPASLTAASRSSQLVVGTRRPDDSPLRVAQIVAHSAGCSVAVVPVAGSRRYGPLCPTGFGLSV
jgi:hypothetical protein